MYSRMVLMVVCWRYGMPFDANGCVSTLMNVDWINGCIFALMSLKLVLMIVYFLVMNSKRCSSDTLIKELTLSGVLPISRFYLYPVLFAFLELNLKLNKQKVYQLIAYTALLVLVK